MYRIAYATDKSYVRLRACAETLVPQSLPVYQNLGTHRDWPVKKAIVNLPIRLKGNWRHTSGNCLSPLGPRTRIIGTLRSNDATATRTSLKKVCLRSFSLYSDYSFKNFVKCRRTLLKLNFKGPYPSSEREIKFRRCLFMSSIKHEIRHFHVAVVQKQERNVQKKCDARAKLLFCL